MAFKKGQSGNPNGRPTQIASAQQLRDAISKDIPEILQVIKEAALAGDMAACKLLLDKTYPAIKPQSLPIVVPVGETLSQTGGNILNTTLQGGISPDIGAMLITALANQGKLVEIDELTKRIEALENQPPEQKL